MYFQELDDKLLVFDQTPLIFLNCIKSTGMDCRSDCVFVLPSMIDKIVDYEKQKLYCAFLDFSHSHGVNNSQVIWLSLPLVTDCN